MSVLTAAGKILRAGSQFLRAIPRSSNVVAYTDNFTTYSAAPLDGQGNWVDGTSEGDHVYVVNDSGNNVVSGEVGSWDGIARRSDITNPNQFSQLVLTAVAGGQLGVVVRSQGSLTTQDYFAYYITNGTRTLQQVLNRAVSVRGSVASGASPGDIIKIEARDMSVYCYYNGEIDTAMSGGGVYTIPAGMEAGMPGIMAYGSTTQGDNWQGGYYRKTLADDFQTYTVGELHGQGPWVDNTYQTVTGISIIDVAGDKRFRYNVTYRECCAVNSFITTPNQWSQVTIDDNSAEIGAVVRGTKNGNDNAFISYQQAAGARHLFYVINDTWTLIEEHANGGAIGDTLKIEIEGTIVKCYFNGSLDSLMPSGGTIDISTVISTHSQLASGSPGMNAYYNSGSYGQGDNWQGGEL